jgi:benzoyl-CoA reductase/2-hydroxyglutaryl-CoA dehydratase subunit BcrC/BadD/HgdB
VADLLCTGMRSFLYRLDVPLTESLDELLKALADYYFDQPACIHRRPNVGYYRLARQLAAEYRAEGVVFKTLLFCDAYQLEASRLEKELGLPFLHLDTDYGAGNVEQTRTRIEAFIETLG